MYLEESTMHDDKHLALALSTSMPPISLFAAAFIHSLCARPGLAAMKEKVGGLEEAEGIWQGGDRRQVARREGRACSAVSDQ